MKTLLQLRAILLTVREHLIYGRHECALQLLNQTVAPSEESSAGSSGTLGAAAHNEGDPKQLDVSPRVKAWLSWEKSDVGKRCMDGAAEGRYLLNRLWYAFMAGADFIDDRSSVAELSVVATCPACLLVTAAMKLTPETQPVEIGLFVLEHEPLALGTGHPGQAATRVFRTENLTPAAWCNGHGALVQHG